MILRWVRAATTERSHDAHHPFKRRAAKNPPRRRVEFAQCGERPPTWRTPIRLEVIGSTWRCIKQKRDVRFLLWGKAQLRTASGLRSQPNIAASIRGWAAHRGVAAAHLLARTHSVRVPCGCEAVGEGSRLLMPRPLSRCSKKRAPGHPGLFRSSVSLRGSHSPSRALVSRTRRNRRRRATRTYS